MTQLAQAPAAEQRVEVVSGDGRRGTILASDIPALEKSGGRVLTPADLAEERTNAAYEKQSTLQKVATVASMAGPVGYPLHAYLRTHGAELPPELGAYQEGVGTGFTGGLSELGLKEATRVVGGDAAAKAYVQGVDDLKAAHPTAYGAGVVAGIGGSIAAGNAGAAGKIAAPIGAGAALAGNLVERGAGRLVAGLAERGVAGKALAAAAKLGARGAAEGALYGAATETTDQLVHDHDLAAEKIYGAAGTGALAGLVGGAALGGAGSLVGSAGSKVASVLRRAPAEAEAEAVAKAGAEAEAPAADAVASAASEGPATEASTKYLENNVVRDQANKQFWRAINSGGLSPTKSVKQATRLLGSPNAVGEVLGRRVIPKLVDATASGPEQLAQAMKNGTVEDMLPIIQSERAASGQALGEMRSAASAPIKASEVWDAIEAVAKPYEAAAATRPMGRAINNLGADILDSLGVKLPARPAIPGLTLPADFATYPPEIRARITEQAQAAWKKAADAAEVKWQADIRDALEKQHVQVPDVFRERYALDKVSFQDNAALNPSTVVEAKRTLRGKLEALIEKAVDEGDKGLSGEKLAEYTREKRDFLALKIAEERAEDSLARNAKNHSLGLTAKAVGLTVGAASHAIGIPGIIAGPAAAALTETLNKRGNMALGVLLSRMADAGIVTRAQQSVDAAVARASKGMLGAPKAATSAAVRDLIPRAQRIVQDVRAAQTNPQAYIDRVTKQAEPLASTTPGVANSYTATLTRAAAFMASKIPETPPTDPLDPHAPPMLTHDQADKIVTYGTYVNQPMKFLDDLSKGVFSFEGAEVLQTLMPKTFAELQASTAQGLAELRAQGKQLPYWQTEKLGLLLDFPATPAQRPDHIAFLQSQIAAAQAPPGPNQAIGGSGGAKPPRRPMPTRSTTSNVLDRLAESGPGRT